MIQNFFIPKKPPNVNVERPGPLLLWVCLLKSVRGERESSIMHLQPEEEGSGVGWGERASYLPQLLQNPLRFPPLTLYLG